MKLRAVHIDGTLYVSIAAFLFIQTFFSSDESYKYVNPAILYWTKFCAGLLGAITGAMKMYRSTAYADSLKDIQK